MFCVVYVMRFFESALCVTVSLSDSFCEEEGGLFCVHPRIRMRPQSCKHKGRRFQQKVARTILDAFPHLTEDDVRSTSMGAPGEDVKLSTEARRCLPVSIECKCVERLNVWQCLDQARSNTPVDVTPCLIFSRNRSETYAVVPWGTLLGLYRRLDRPAERIIPPRLRRLLRELREFDVGDCDGENEEERDAGSVPAKVSPTDSESESVGDAGDERDGSGIS